MRLRGARFRERGRGPSPLFTRPMRVAGLGAALGGRWADARGGAAGCGGGVRREECQAARVTGRVTRTRTEGVELKR